MSGTPSPTSAPSMGAILRVKDPNMPGSGKCIAKSKGVHREVESEGSWRQTSGLTNRNHMRLQLRIRLLDKSKSNNYTELIAIYVADRWRERLRSYLGRAHGRKKQESGNTVETRFVVSSQQTP